MFKLMTLMISLTKLEESKQKNLSNSHHYITQPTSICTLALCLLACPQHELHVFPL